MTQLVQHILNSGKKFVITVTGGGSSVFDMLLKHGGGSKVLLEGNIPYSKESLDSFCYGAILDKSVSLQTAIAIAQHSYERAHGYVDADDDSNVVGVGLTAKLTYDGERVGREHRVCLAWKTINDGGFLELSLNPSLSREEQESVCGKLVLNVIGSICNVPDDSKFKLYNEVMEIKI